jgi:hypothetical protein
MSWPGITKALVTNTTRSQNTASGFQALNQNTGGSNDTATGYNALFNNNGSNNTASGMNALYNNTFGSTTLLLGITRFSQTRLAATTPASVFSR